MSRRRVLAPGEVPPKRGRPATGVTFPHRKTFDLLDRHVELLRRVAERRSAAADGTYVSLAEALRAVLDSVEADL